MKLFKHFYAFCSLAVAPIIKQQPKVIRVQKTKVVIIETYVRCAAPPEVQWFKDQTKIKEDSRKTVNIEQVSKVGIPNIFTAQYL